jgi:L-asparagine transporter-like permease
VVVVVAVVTIVVAIAAAVVLVGVAVVAVAEVVFAVTVVVVIAAMVVVVVGVVVVGKEGTSRHLPEAQKALGEEGYVVLEAWVVASRLQQDSSIGCSLSNCSEAEHYCFRVRYHL